MFASNSAYMVAICISYRVEQYIYYCHFTCNIRACVPLETAMASGTKTSLLMNLDFYKVVRTNLICTLITKVTVVLYKTWQYSTISRLTVVSHEAKKKQHARAS